MQEIGPGRWRGRTEADLLRRYLESLEGKLTHVVGSPDALPVSREMAEAALGDLAQAQGFVDTLSPPQAREVWNCMRLAMLVESVTTNELHARAAQRGADHIRGDRKGAAANRRAIEQQKKLARERYQFHAAKSPEASRKALCSTVSDELASMFGDECRARPKTIATWVPNPRAERRGRPRKN